MTVSGTVFRFSGTTEETFEGFAGYFTMIF